MAPSQFMDSPVKNWYLSRFPRIILTAAGAPAMKAWTRGQLCTKKLANFFVQSCPRVQAFMAGAPAAVKMILGNLDKYQFFTGESMNCDGAIGLLDYREDGVTPFLVFFKDGIEIEKY
uniref:Translationally-controlled tumor protein n=1 Tax=Salmo salar TaxID=8030 RepID=C0H8B2_SALSA|nr:Translationally-controlled tumor protein [Salmo salar]ACN12639.1 Translationally-controlled tumor protein [Salmo salar]